MKKTTRAIAAVLAGVSALGCAACQSGSGNVENDPNIIQIDYWKSGNGLDWLEDLIERFEVAYPEYKVAFDYTSQPGRMKNTIELGEKYNSIDLYVSQTPPSNYYQYFEPLDDILNNVATTAETKTVKDKLGEQVVKNLTEKNVHVYQLPYAKGICGLVYNADIIDGVNYSVPNTTDELETLVMALYDDHITPFIHHADREGGYWYLLYYIWQIQYDGLDYYYNTWLPCSTDGVTPSKEVFLREDGRKKVLDYMQNIITPDYCYTGSNNLSFTDAQTIFLSGEAAMAVNGSWLIYEMKEHLAKDSNFKIMKAPVISKIVEKLEDTSMSDKTLSRIVAEVDAGKTESEFCSINDFERIKEARNLMYSNSENGAFFIPKYSNAKEGAKKFIQFYYTDESLKRDAAIRKSGVLCSLDQGEYDMTDWSDWDKYIWKLSSEITPISSKNSQKSLLWELGGTTYYANQNFVNYFASRGNDRKTATQVWETMQKTINEQWDNFLTNAGL